MNQKDADAIAAMVAQQLRESEARTLRTTTKMLDTALTKLMPMLQNVADVVGRTKAQSFGTKEDMDQFIKALSHHVKATMQPVSVEVVGHEARIAALEAELARLRTNASSGGR